MGAPGGHALPGRAGRPRPAHLSARMGGADGKKKSSLRRKKVKWARPGGRALKTTFLSNPSAPQSICVNLRFTPPWCSVKFILKDGTHRTGAAVFQEFRHRESGESSESGNSRFPAVSKILFKIRRIRRIRGAFLFFSIVTRSHSHPFVDHFSRLDVAISSDTLNLTDHEYTCPGTGADLRQGTPGSTRR